MKCFVNTYVGHCENCLHSLPTNQLPTGLLHPLQIAEHPWEEIAYDLITSLPVSKSFDTIFTVDHFSKMVHYIHTKSTATAVNIANLFVTYVCKLHGLPKKIVEDWFSTPSL
jgi:hypothetical protein